MLRRKFSVLGLAATLLVAGCRAPDVIVTDDSGAAIEKAKITGISLSIGGQSTETDSRGQAQIPFAVQDTKWIVVSKSGYYDSEQMDVSAVKPIRVTLKKK
jgi:hypothetical protein